MTRDALVEAARLSIVRGSRSFAAASRLFDRATRERAWLLYAWCRRCDDIADGQDHGHGMTRLADAPERLAAIRAMTERALAGEEVGDPPFDALRVVAAETHLPPALPRDLVAGFALDAADWRPASEDDLYRYCYHVAGVVGRMMAIVMGVAPDDRDTLHRATDLGIAFQLANIARDLAEDAAVGRCYLPRDWLAEMEIPPGGLMDPASRTRLAALARRLVDRAALHEGSARIGAAMLGFRSAWAVLAAADIYGAIGRKVAARGERAWDRRVTTSASEKAGAIARASWLAMRRRHSLVTPRHGGLWTYRGSDDGTIEAVQPRVELDLPPA